MVHPAPSVRGVVLWLAVAAALAGTAGAQVTAPPAIVHRPWLKVLACPRVADPKLPGSSVPIRYQLATNGAIAAVTVTVEQGGQIAATVFSGNEVGDGKTIGHVWDGTNVLGKVLDPGDYKVVVRAKLAFTLESSAPIAIVRLGITAIDAQPSAGDDQWPMVYHLKALTKAFYATPAIHEYFNVAEAGQISDLDLDDGSPRPSAPMHTAVDTAATLGGDYEQACYNYPLAYLVSASPRFEVTFGASATSALTGSAVGVGYPVDGCELRAVASDELGAWSSQSAGIVPGGSATFSGPELPRDARRSDRTVSWKWQYRTSVDGEWNDVAGHVETQHRFYTQIGAPKFAPGAVGTQYAGPWVEVADDVDAWRQAIGVPTGDEAGVLEALMKGFFGQNNSIPTAIEGVKYDCPSLGGDGGASHYFSFTTWSVQLANLLNAHKNGAYVNCSDVASSTSSMASMLGISNCQMVRLGFMQLKAIWGIGAPGYTLNLWGSGHSFSYHHIITRDGAYRVSDSCMCLDVDGDASTLPGTPGFNVDRPWDGPDGYLALSASNAVTKSLDPLPKLQ